MLILSIYTKNGKPYSSKLKRKSSFKVLGELGRTASLLRDVLNDDFVSILVNDEKLYDEIKDYITTISPDQAKIVRIYTGKIPLFKNSK